MVLIKSPEWFHRALQRFSRKVFGYLLASCMRMFFRGPGRIVGHLRGGGVDATFKQKRTGKVDWFIDWFKRHAPPMKSCHAGEKQYDIDDKPKKRTCPEDTHSRSTEQRNQDENRTRQTASKQNKEQQTSRPRNAIRQHRWQTNTENAKRDMNSMANKERKRPDNARSRSTSLVFPE